MTGGTAPLDPPERRRVATPFILCTLIWSSTWLAIRSQLGVVPPGWSVAYRFGIAAAAMLVYAAMSRARLRLTPREHAFALTYGVAQYCLNYYAVYLAERSVTSGLVAVLFALLLVPNALFGRVFLKQAVSRPFLAGSAVALAGMAFLFAHELAVVRTGHAALAAGIAWSLAAVLASSVANVMQAARIARGVPVTSLIAWGMVWGTAVDIAAAWTIEGPPVFDPAPHYWLVTLYLGLVGSALAFTFYFQVVRAIGPARAAYSSVLTPALAMLLSTLFEGYRWSWQAVLGCALALGGLAIALWARQSARPAR